MVLKLLPFQGAWRNAYKTQGVALGQELLPFQGVWSQESRTGWMKEERGWMKEERDGWGVNRVNS